MVLENCTHWSDSNQCEGGHQPRNSFRECEADDVQDHPARWVVTISDPPPEPTAPSSKWP